MIGRRLTRRFFARDPLVVARDLLGRVLVSDSEAGLVAVRLTEVEAYAGSDDPASHAFRGPTNRNAVMFGPAGHLYVYFVYGMHWCANVVTGHPGTACGVLLRAGEVVAGVELAVARRPSARSAVVLARGPAGLTAVLGMGAGDDGDDLCAPGAGIRLHSGRRLPDEDISVGPRVGVAAAADRPWRFWQTGSPSVTTYRPAVKRVRS